MSLFGIFAASLYMIILASINCGVPQPLFPPPRLILSCLFSPVYAHSCIYEYQCVLSSVSQLKRYIFIAKISMQNVKTFLKAFQAMFLAYAVVALTRLPSYPMFLFISCIASYTCHQQRNRYVSVIYNSLSYRPPRPQVCIVKSVLENILTIGNVKIVM